MGYVPPGSCVATSSGNLPGKFLIHTVGPVFDKHNPETSYLLLYAAIYNTLKKASTLKCKSITIPCISTGLFGFPKDKCAEITLYVCSRWAQFDSQLERIRLTNINNATVKVFTAELEKSFPASKMMK